MIIDEKRPEDLDTTLDDHAVDACRYGLTHCESPMEAVIKKTKDQIAYDRLINPDPDGWTYTWKD
jgi:hypothetical protein